MAMLLLLDRRPHSAALRGAVARAVEAVPRLRQRVVDAPLDLALPRWEDDPTFDLDFHVRRYAVSHEDGAPHHATLADLFATLGPIYERPFDRSRPLWEVIELDGPGPGAALFFRLHHGVADGVGGNTILAALTDASADAAPPIAPAERPPGGFRDRTLTSRLAEAAGHRALEAAGRAQALVGGALALSTRPRAWWDAARIVADVASSLAGPPPLPLPAFGRARHLLGFDLPFEPLRKARAELGGQMIDLMLCATLGAVGAWLRAHGHDPDRDVATLVPINLRPRAEQGAAAGLGNRATGLLLPLPVGIDDPRARFREVHRRVAERKAHPGVALLPKLAEALAVVPRPLFRALSRRTSEAVQLIVTNVPGIMQPRFLAGARVTAGYPFAPLAPRCPWSVALYGYDGRLFVGIDADGTAVPDLPAFAGMLRESFDALLEA